MLEEANEVCRPYRIESGREDAKIPDTDDDTSDDEYAIDEDLHSWNSDEYREYTTRHGDLPDILDPGEREGLIDTMIPDKDF